MTDTPDPSRLRRIVLLVEAWLLVVPALMVSLTLGALDAAFSDAKFEPVVILAQTLLMFAADVALFLQLGTLRRRGRAALLETRSAWLAAVHSGAILVALGLLAHAARACTGLPTFDALTAGALGLPTLVPYAHVLVERHRARRLLGPEPTSSARSAKYSFVTGASLVLAIVAGHWVTTGPLPFDRASWDALAEDWYDPRYRRNRMVDGLLLTSTLQGKTRAQIVAMFGEPPRTGYFDEWPMVYPIGSERGFMGIDSEWLVLRFDAAGKVEEARIVRD
jgi:hypothetical protein